MKKAATSNTFQDGLLMDLNPLSTPNNVLTNCLNGTLVTYNGNENVLQNDMGNGRVETAFLPEGYVPLGTTEYGGIIYIVSYNPLNKQCQIGSFPSPERNITYDEACNADVVLSEDSFLDSEEIAGFKIIKKGIVKLAFSKVEFNPGDFYKVYLNDPFNKNEDFNLASVLSDYDSKSLVYSDPNYRKKILIDIVSVNKDGGITSFSDSLKWYKSGTQLPVNEGPAYYIPDTDENFEKQIQQGVPINLDEYRNLVTTPYNVFKSKSTGTLALLCKLEIPSTFQVTYEIIELKLNTNKNGDVIIGRKKVTIKFTPVYDKSLDNLIFKFTETYNGNTSELSEKVIINGVEVKELTEEQTDELPDIYTINGYIVCKKANDYTIEFDLFSDSILNYEIYPATDYGVIKYLSNQGSIDLSKIGSGQYDITSWEYYNSGEYITLNFYSDIYPKPQHEVTAIYLQFLPISNEKDGKGNSIYQEYYTESIQNQIQNAEKYYKEKKIVTLKLEKPSYSGDIVENIYYKQDLLYGYLLPNNFYQVHVIYELTNKYSTIDVIYEEFYKSMYTNSMFNIEYGSDSDFTTFDLKDYLTVNSTLISNPTQANIAIETEEYTQDAETKVCTQNSKFNVIANNDILVNPYFDNNFNTFTIGSFEISNNGQSDKETIDSSSIINIGTINTNIDHSVTGDNTISVDANKLKLKQEFNKVYTLPILYTEKQINHMFAYSYRPIISTSDDIANLGLIEISTDNSSFGYTFAPSKVMTMFYTDIAGKRAGTVVGTASLQNVENTDQKYYTQSLDDLAYTSPGYSDDNNTYVIGRNDYKTGETALGGLDKVGFDDSFNNICQDIGSPIVVCVYASIKDGDFDSHQQLHSVTPSVKSKGTSVGNSWLYFKEGTQGITENNGSKTTYQIYILTDKGYYRPINILNKTRGTNFLKNGEAVVENNILDQFDYIIKYFMQLYRLDNIADSREITVVENIKYYDKYVIKNTTNIDYSINISDILINGVSIGNNNFQKLEGNNLNNSFTNVKQNGNISLSFNLVNEDLINKKYSEQTPNVNTIIYTVDGNTIQTNNNYSDMTAVYYLKDGVPIRLNDMYSQFIAYDGVIKKDGSKYKLDFSKNTPRKEISKPLSVAAYEINDGRIQLKTGTISSNTFKLTLTDSKDHTGTISKMLNFEPIKFD